MTVSVARAGLEYNIQEIIEPSLEEMGYALVRVRFQYQSPTNSRRRDRRIKRVEVQPSGRLQLMLERKDGEIFGIDDCSKVHRHVSVLLDVADPIDHAFQLEISSTGIARPLTKNSDFKFFLTYGVDIHLTHLVDGRRRFKGVLLSQDEENITIQQEDEECFQIPLIHIAEARLLTDSSFIDHELKPVKNLNLDEGDR